MKYDIKNDNILKIIKESNIKGLYNISDEIRNFLIESLSESGGHLASNLGIVELTVAIHKVYESPKDKIIFDVGHQSYIHKIITGRANKFDTLRKLNGISGFPKSSESIHDAYDTGHSSTSIGAAAGIATANLMCGKKNDKVVAVIGDGSMTGGLSYEALNNIGYSNLNVKIILNDNGMSISKNVGAISKHLQRITNTNNYLKAKKEFKEKIDNIPIFGKKLSKQLKKAKSKIKYSILDDTGIIFEELGIKYIGPIDGHNINEMIAAFQIANKIDRPTIVHVVTKKGKGYHFSEKYPNKFHGIGPFNLKDGNILSSKDSDMTFSEAFGEALVREADKNKNIVAITAAMGSATGLGKFYEYFPKRYFDVGIAESYAVLFAAGLAKNGIRPVVAIYSSFLQRAFDQIISDVALQNLPVVFAIDRSGLVGSYGETHNGQFDISYLKLIPNMTILTPRDYIDLDHMLHYALKLNKPVAIRYPRGKGKRIIDIPDFNGENFEIQEGKDITIIAVGTMLKEAVTASAALEEKGYEVGIISIGIIKNDINLFESINSKLIITLEDNVINGGFGEFFKSVCPNNPAILNIGIPDEFIKHGTVDEQKEICHMNPDSIVKGALEYFERKA